MTAVTITQIALLAWRDRERQTDRKIETQRETETERMTVTIIQIALLASGQADGNEDVPKVEFENLKVGSDRVSSAISVSVQGGAGRGRVEEDGECGVAKGEAGEKEAVLHKLCENDEAIRNVLKKAAGNGNAAWRAEGAACGGEATSVSDDELLLTVGVGAGVAQQVRAIEGGMDPPDGCDAQCPVGGNASALGRAGISAAGGAGKGGDGVGQGKGGDSGGAARQEKDDAKGVSREMGCSGDGEGGWGEDAGGGDGGDGGDGGREQRGAGGEGAGGLPGGMCRHERAKIVQRWGQYSLTRVLFLHSCQIFSTCMHLSWSSGLLASIG